MTKTRKPYNNYTREFKLEAVRLMEESGRSPAELARELGIRRNQLYNYDPHCLSSPPRFAAYFEKG